MTFRRACPAVVCRAFLVLTPSLGLPLGALVWEARAEPAVRTEVPVKRLTLPDGAIRFALPVKVGETTIEAGLDTGSVGLRILPGVLKSTDEQTTDEADTTRFAGAGAMLTGVVAKGMVDIAGLKGGVRFQQVKDVACMPQKPNCPAQRIPQSEYGIMGNGIADAGFKAIIGIGPRKVAIDNPFRQLGATRFIVELPRDEGETGRIILNPSEEDTRGFTQIPPYKRIAAQTALPEDAVHGCLSARAEKKICGAVTFDSGAPAMRVVSPDALGYAWPEGTKIELTLDDGVGHPLFKDTWTIGGEKELTRLSFGQLNYLPKTIIRMGVAPYMNYAVLYDLDRSGLAVKSRGPR